MYKLPNSLDSDIRYINSLIQDYSDGKVSGAQLKAVRVPMGVYEQRENGVYMLRIRCTGGFITPKQLKKVTETGEQIHASHVHITSRQEVQLHNIDLNQAVPGMKSLQTVGLSTKGGGGNTIRNMLVDVRSGISDKEVFDLYPYASDLTTFLIAQKDSFTMPRKLKIAFALSADELGYALVNDLGFIPVIKDGKRGFTVYLGGSVASNPHTGWKIFDFLPEEDLFRVAVAAKQFFSENGNRKNRQKARIRYIFYKLGEDAAKELFYTYFKKAKEDQSLDYKVSDEEPLSILHPSFDAIKDGSLAFRLWKARYAFPQKQDGLFAVFLPFDHGNAPVSVFSAIADFAGSFGDDTLRFNTRQSLQIRNLPELYLPNLYALLKSLNFPIDQPLILNNITSCTGADTCRLGICYSKGLQRAIASRLTKSNLSLDELADLHINISGCSNSCDQQIWADLGFSGRVFRINEHSVPAYNVYVRVEGNFALGQSLGSISAYDAPVFVEDVLRHYLSHKPKYGGFTEYVADEGKDYIESLLKNSKTIPAFEEDKNYYFDWGANEIFSLTSRGQAECSAGLFDLIDIDKNLIESNRKKFTTAADDEEREHLLYNIAFSASRMLLITRGAEPRSEDEAFVQFRNLFIDSRLIDNYFDKVVDAARNHRSLIGQELDVQALADAVIKLYEGMDDSLQFKSEEIHKQEDSQTSSEASSSAVVKDLRGVLCPLNFVKTKIALSALKSGDLLEVWLDDGQPIENVPGSVRNEGHTVVSATKSGDYWKVLIMKK